MRGGSSTMACQCGGICQRLVSIRAPFHAYGATGMAQHRRRMQVLARLPSGVNFRLPLREGSRTTARRGNLGAAAEGALDAFENTTPCAEAATSRNLLVSSSEAGPDRAQDLLSAASLAATAKRGRKPEGPGPPDRTAHACRSWRSLGSGVPAGLVPRRRSRACASGRRSPAVGVGPGVCSPCPTRGRGAGGVGVDSSPVGILFVRPMWRFPPTWVHPW